MKTVKKFLIGIAIGLVILASLLGGAISDRLFGYRILDRFFPRPSSEGKEIVKQRLLTEESVVIEVAEKVSPSVVTVGITKTQKVLDLFEWDPFMDPFGFFRSPKTKEEKIQQDIGSGFIISSDGLVVTNKHVVADTQAKYRVITKDDKEYEVKKIYRDPVNDLAILKIEATGLKPVELGDSDNLKVGQFVIAIGTALGQFRHTVTTGVISGLGRGITAGSPFEGYVERLDNVIQTDAAINPGNSGGPLLNSAGQVIGVNVAVAAEGQNIGFALPINLVKETIKTFEETGRFERPFLGVRYRMISQDLALLNDVPQGAYVVEVVDNSPADKAGIKEGDIITKLDGQPVREKDGGLAKLINQKKVGERVKITIWRDEKEKELEVVLAEMSE
ncbi:MAG: S1C family serine protease [Microgenomates group bacterium]